VSGERIGAGGARPFSSPAHTRLRRRLLGFGGAFAAAALLAGHTPYRQWKLYRQHHLLVFTSRDDPISDELGEKLAARLRDALPESRARVARAPNVERIASLLTTQQADVAVLARPLADALYRRAAPFEDFLPVALRVLADNATHQVVCRDDFKPLHAYLVASALTAGPDPVVMLPAADGSVPPHPGALAVASGAPPQE
jgi:hypothetical protein